MSKRELSMHSNAPIKHPTYTYTEEKSKDYLKVLSGTYKRKKTQDDRVMDAITFLWILIFIMMSITRFLEG